MFIRTYVAAILLAAPAYGITFRSLGQLNDAYPGTVAHAVSDDGTTVVGRAYAGVEEGWVPFRWNREVGIESLGLLPGRDDFDFASGVSADGSVIVGNSPPSTADELGRAFRWTEDTGIELIELGPVGGEMLQDARSVSADGSVIVGNAGSISTRLPRDTGFRLSTGHDAELLSDPVYPENPCLSEIFEEEGCEAPETARTYIGEYPRLGGDYVSADGEVVIGSVGPRSEGVAFRWTTEDGLTPIGKLFEDSLASVPTSISADGNIVVGNDLTGEHGSRSIAWRWDELSGMQQLHTPTNVLSVEAFDLSQDGSIIGGYYTTDDEPEMIAVLWIDGQLVTVNDYLESHGFGLEGQRLLAVTAITADGQTLAVSGENQEGRFESWIVNLAPAEPADFNRDGAVDTKDYLVWSNSFGATGEGLLADANKDGTVNTADYTVWRDTFHSDVSISLPEPACSLLAFLGLGHALNQSPRTRRKTTT